MKPKWCSLWWLESRFFLAYVLPHPVSLISIKLACMFHLVVALHAVFELFSLLCLSELADLLPFLLMLLCREIYPLARAGCLGCLLVYLCLAGSVYCFIFILKDDWSLLFDSFLACPFCWPRFPLDAMGSILLVPPLDTITLPLRIVLHCLVANLFPFFLGILCRDIRPPNDKDSLSTLLITLPFFLISIVFASFPCQTTVCSFLVDCLFTFSMCWFWFMQKVTGGVVRGSPLAEPPSP